MDKRIKEKLDVKRRNQIIAGVSIGAVLLLSILYIFTRPEQIANVRTEAVSSRNLTSTLNYTSKVMPADIQSEYAPNQKILRLHVNVGDRVTEGQLLAEMDNSELEKMVADTESAFLDASSAIDMANLGMLNPSMLSSIMPGLSQEALMAQLTSNLQSSLLDSVKGLGGDLIEGLEFPGLGSLPELTPEQRAKLMDSLKRLEGQVGEVKHTLADFKLPTLEHISGLDSIDKSRIKASMIKLSGDLRSFIDSEGAVNNLPPDIASLTNAEKEMLYSNINTLLTDMEKAELEENPLEPTDTEIAEGTPEDPTESTGNEVATGENPSTGTTPTPKPSETPKPQDPTPAPKPTQPAEPKDNSNIIITDLSILSKQERGVLYSYYGRLLQDLDAHLQSGADVDLPETISKLPTAEKWKLLRELRDVYEDLRKEFDSGMVDFDLATYYKGNSFCEYEIINTSSFGNFNMDMFSGTIDQGGNILNQLQYANSSASEMLRNAKTEIRAEFDGLVVAINGKEGETISATMSTPFMEIYDDRFLTITVNANRNDALRINVGQKVTYTIDDMQFDGEVTFKSPIATEAAGNIASMTGSSEPTVRIEMDIKGKDIRDLIIGFPIDASIEVDSVINAISIPAQAVLRDQDEYYVFVVKDKEIIRRRKITLGVQTQEYVEVNSGLLIGDEVVLNPNANMQDGQRVKVDE